MKIDTTSVDFFIQAAIAIIVITLPPDPAKILIFNQQLKEDTPAERHALALRLALICTGILAGVALVGREILDLLGINLGAFGVAGGLIVAGMGFEMLGGGKVSRAQGGPNEPEPDADTGLIVPLAIPLIAGPGATTTMIAIVAADDTGSALLAGLIASGVLGVVVYASYAWLGSAVAKIPPRPLAIAIRIGGLLLATIGIQLLLGGIGNFYGITG